MDQNPLDPDDRLRGRPPGRTRKVMNVSMALDVYNALMKIPEGKRSAFIADKLRPIAKQFDPGPSSVVVLSLKYLLDSAIADSKNKHDYEKLAAVSSLANEIMPVLNPYLDLCKETDSEKVQSFDMVKETDSIKEMLDNIRASRIFKKLKDILKNAEIIHNAVPQRYRDQQYEKNLEETKVASETVSHLLVRYTDYVIEEQVFPNVPSETLEEMDLFSRLKAEAELDFRKSLPFYEIVNGCRRILKEVGRISDKKTRRFVMHTCNLVDRSVRKCWGSGIRIEMNSYGINPENGRFLITLYNSGQYGASIGDVRCDGNPVTYHAKIGSDNHHHLPPQEESVVEVNPCTSLTKKPRHKVTFEVGYVEFSFELAG